MSETLDPFAELKRSKEALREGLTLVDRSVSGDVGGDDESFAKAWDQLAARFETKESPEALRARVAPARLPEFDAELQELIRLNAVLAAGVAGEQQMLLARLRAVRETRRDLSFYSAVATEGERCDISG